MCSTKRWPAFAKLDKNREQFKLLISFPLLPHLYVFYAASLWEVLIAA